MAKAWYDYELKINASSTCQLYGIINTVPSALKTQNVRIGGYIQAACGGVPGYSTCTAQCELKFKINGASEERLAYGYKTGSSSGADTGQQSFEKTLSLANVTKLGFNLNGEFSSSGQRPTGNFFAYIWIEMATEFGTETFITAKLLNDLVGFVGAGSAVSTGSVIKIANYNALASAVGSSSFDTTKPLSANLTTLISNVNGKGFPKQWDSTNQSDY